MKAVLAAISLFFLCLFTIHAVEAEVVSDDSRYQQYMQSLKLLPEGMNRNQLKVFLMDRYFDVYVIYRDLPDSKQQQVFDFYSRSEAADIDELGALVEELI